jgi:hypothetical protein
MVKSAPTVAETPQLWCLYIKLPTLGKFRVLPDGFVHLQRGTAKQSRNFAKVNQLVRVTPKLVLDELRDILIQCHDLSFVLSM